MSDKTVLSVTESPIKKHRIRPTTSDIDFLLSSNSTILEHELTIHAIPRDSDVDYDNWRRHLSRTRQSFKVRGLYKSQTLEQVLDRVQTERQLQLISGHLVRSALPRDGVTNERVKKEIEARNNVFLKWIVEAMYRQLSELNLVSGSKLWGKTRK